LEKKAKQKNYEYDELYERLTNVREIQVKENELKTNLTAITDSSKNIKAIIGGFEYSRSTQ
jgi:hypothetical protein